MATMNFSGILSRKAGMRVNNAMNSAVKNREEVEVAVATIQEPKPAPATPAPEAPKRAKARKELEEMHRDAVDVTPVSVSAPVQPAPKQKVAPSAPAAKKKEATPKKEASPKQEKPRLTLMQYSEKCVALFGDTKPIKDELKKMGGRYNPNLHPFGQDTSVPGWVFPNKYREDVESLINKK